MMANPQVVSSHICSRRFQWVFLSGLPDCLKSQDSVWNLDAFLISFWQSDFFWFSHSRLIFPVFDNFPCFSPEFWTFLNHITAFLAKLNLIIIHYYNNLILHHLFSLLMIGSVEVIQSATECFFIAKYLRKWNMN